jgi:sugar fermentation stimulation protein A
VIFIKYKNVKKGVFVERPNRFIAKVLVDGNIETVHVKNTGRCKELLVNGATVYLSVAVNPLRKTKYDLVGVEKVCERGTIMVNMDSQIPNDVAGEWLRNGNLFSENAVIKREVFYNKSRFDFYVEDEGRRIFLEVKGVTLENNSVASFPDAPTERGIKHINELVDAVAEGFEAYILFVIQMKNIDYFTPNYETHPEFGEALRIARDKGVKILAFDCTVSEDSIEIDKNIKVIL